MLPFVERREIYTRNDSDVLSLECSDYGNDNKSLFRLATLNVSGCKNIDKRDDIDQVLLYHKVDMAALQEVNVDGEVIGLEGLQKREE